jgi:FKBP-type peptidyl-prolyl cis-trans isomerase
VWRIDPCRPRSSAARRRLERQLQRRVQREAARKRFTLIASIAGTLVLIVVIAVVVAATTGDSKKKSAAASTSPSITPSSTASSFRAATGAAVEFMGVKVDGAKDLGGKPGVSVSKPVSITKLQYKDLVVGTGKAPSATSTVTVQYVGVLYANGGEFDSSWGNGPTQFSLTQVVKGFTYGIGGTTGVPPMKVGGRRVIIMPSALGYGAQANGQIPANSTLVFVVDLKSIDK